MSALLNMSSILFVVADKQNIKFSIGEVVIRILLTGGLLSRAGLSLVEEDREDRGSIS